MGAYTTNGYFYKPSLGACGTVEMNKFHAALDLADAAIASVLGLVESRMRCSHLVIADGTNADTIKVNLATNWNGDTIAIQDNLGKPGDETNFALSADGSQLTIKAAGLTGSCIGVSSAEIFFNETNIWETQGLIVEGNHSSNNIVLSFKKGTDGTVYDLTGAGIANGDIKVKVTYVTNQ